MNFNKTILIAFALTGIMLQAFSQEEINFTFLTTKEGLSSNTVNTILKDRFGFLWFGTEDGLNKFDGINFKIYRSKPNDSSSLKSNEILSLYEDPKGNIWVGTSGGCLSLYDRKKDAFINYPTGNRPGEIPNNVIRDIRCDFTGKLWIAHFNGVSILDPSTRKVSNIPLQNDKDLNILQKKSAICLFEDSKHFMWIGTADGLFEYNPAAKALTHFLHTDNDPKSLSGNSINTIKEDKKGNIWIGTDGGLSLFKEETKSFFNYLADPYNPQKLSSKDINGIAIDGEKLWLATGAGLDIMNVRTGMIEKFKADYRNVLSLSSYSVRCIYKDTQGIYWLGMVGGGVNKYDKNLNLFNFIKSNPFDEKGLTIPTVSSFGTDANGHIYLGTEGGGLNLFDLKTKLLHHFNIRSARYNLNNNISVLAITNIEKSQLMLGTFGDGIFIFNPLTGNYRQLLKGYHINDLNSNDIFCIKKDHNGILWVGTNGEGINILNKDYKVIKRYTPNPKFPNDKLLPINGFIRDIEEDSQGNFWIATHGGGIAVLDPHLDKFTIFNTANSKLPNDKVTTLHKDRYGNMWAGTFGGGIVVFNLKNNKTFLFSENNGLYNNSIYKIIEDQKGLIWASTNKAISSIDINNNKIYNYNHHNGVQNNNFISGSGLVISTGEIFFGGLEGFNYFNPTYLKRNINIPQVLLTDLRISNQSVIPSETGPITENISTTHEINLDYKQNFALNFVGLNFTSPEQNQYAYKLEGFDRDWTYTGHSTFASYTNLDPGEYIFHVIASNNDGIWNKKGTSVKIFVHPPFWRTSLAYILYIILIIGIALYLRHRSIRKFKEQFFFEQQKKEAERTRELDRLKIKFLTNLSHEFRTPIALILGPLESLLSQKNENTIDQLQMIKRNARRLLNLVNQLLDFRKMEEQELKLQESEGELIMFIKETSDSFKDLSERKKIDFTFHSNINQFSTCFDHDKIERIIFNILSNAFKFTLEGGKISLAIESMQNPPDAKKSWITIKISDTGIGIPRDKKDKIFERFFQSPSAASILNQGSGIGLSITKEFISLHGGHLNVESEEQKGTAFYVHLPFIPIESKESCKNKEQQEYPEPVISKEHEICKEENPASSVTGSPLVLLVEDNDDFRFYLKDNLRLHFKVIEAANGQEAWQKTLSQHPQLIVSDISMPVMNGIELVKKIKTDKRTSHIPIILLTALSGEKEQIKGLETGANDYITKPFNFEVLIVKINNLLSLNKTLKNTYTKQIQLVAPEVVIQSDDEKLLRTIMEYLEENLTNSQLSVEELSRHVGMSRSTLYNKIIELTGQTPVEYIRSVKLEKAAALLEKSSMNIAQIAYSVGFSTPHYFAKSFKTKFGILPSEFITKARGKTGNESN